MASINSTDHGDPLDLLDLPRIRGDLAAAVHGPEDGGGRVYHVTLSLCSRHLPRALQPQLDL